MAIKYYNTKPLWELEKTDNNLYKKLLSKDNDILKTLESYDLKNRIPFF